MLLRRAIEAGHQSLIFWPPGTGRRRSRRSSPTTPQVRRLSGVESKVADMRRVRTGRQPARTRASQRSFSLTIHRFNKAQQDVLLPDVEPHSAIDRCHDANPLFVNSPLVSRAQIFELRLLGEAELLGRCTAR
jgi:putative ATPase